MSTNILEQLKREGSIALWHDYQLGHANDLSGNGNDGTLANSPWFDRNGLNTTYLGDEAVQVTHSSSINLTTFTVVAFIASRRISQYSPLGQLVRKQDAVGGLSWSLRLNDFSRDRIDLDSAVSATWNPASRSYDGATCIGCNLATGTSTPLYFDGVEVKASLNIAPTISAAASDLFIGNWHTFGRGLGRTISSFILFNKLLSATEHAQVYGQLMKTRRGIIS